MQTFSNIGAAALTQNRFSEFNIPPSNDTNEISAR